MAAEELVEVAKEIAVRVSEEDDEKMPRWVNRIREHVKKGWEESLQRFGLSSTSHRR